MGDLREAGTWLSRVLSRRKPATGDLPSLEVALAGGLSDEELSKFARAAGREADHLLADQKRAILDWLGSYQVIPTITVPARHRCPAEPNAEETIASVAKS